MLKDSILSISVFGPGEDRIKKDAWTAGFPTAAVNASPYVWGSALVVGLAWSQGGHTYAIGDEKVGVISGNNSNNFKDEKRGPCRTARVENKKQEEKKVGSRVSDGVPLNEKEF